VPNGRWQRAEVNGAAALVARPHDGLPIVMIADRIGGRIATIRFCINPEKLGALDRPVSLR
jgi:hypothetical protein